MSDTDKHQQTEEATPKRREDYRRDGKVPVSKEIISLAVLLVAGSTLYMMIAPAGRQLIEASRSVLGQLDVHAADRSGQWLGQVVRAAMLFVIPVGIAGGIAALASGFAQTRGLVSFKALSPNFKQIFNPLPRLKQMFASKQAVVTILQQIGKVAVIVAATYGLFVSELKGMSTIGDATIPQILARLGSVAVQLTLRVAGLLTLFAVLDLIIVRRRMNEQMKMSKQEVKDEHRDQEGSPDVKRARMQRQRELGRNRMISAVADADVVIVNPTHYSVALRYDELELPAPQLTAKGVDSLAARIRQVARKHGVPVIHNPPLARAIYAQVKVEGLVPEKLFGAVAEVLALVYRIKGRTT